MRYLTTAMQHGPLYTLAFDYLNWSVWARQMVTQCGSDAPSSPCPDISGIPRHVREANVATTCATNRRLTAEHISHACAPLAHLFPCAVRCVIFSAASALRASFYVAVWMRALRQALQGSASAPSSTLAGHPSGQRLASAARAALAGGEMR